jgi:hypothetical protein
MADCDSNGQEWWAFCGGHLEHIGACLDFEEADQKSPPGTHWLFSRESLEDFVNKAEKQLVAVQCEIDLAKAGIDTFSPAIDHMVGLV